jgi:hypothetical protein
LPPLAGSIDVEGKVRHVIERSPGSISFRKLQPWAGFFGNLETAVIEWDIHKHPFEQVHPDLKKRGRKTKESGGEFPVAQWVSHKDVQALVQSKE